MRKLAVLLASLAVAGCGEEESTTATPGATGAGGESAGVRTIATELEVPWGLAFEPSGDALVAERNTARIVRVSPSGGKETVMTVPGVDTEGTSEGGLLGLALSPDYRSDGLVYAYLTSTEGDNRIVRFELGGEPEAVLTGLQAGSIHNGGRIAFGPDGKLYAGVGETGDTSLSQDPDSPNGKILRINPDGSIPEDNPSPGSPVWSLGHRNPQGLAWDDEGRMWAIEFGQSELDELNLIEPGNNYGWPEVEGEGDTDGGRFTNPEVTWPTSEASPSGAAIVGDTLYAGALAGEALLRVRLDGTEASKLSSRLDGTHGRIRTVEPAPDGSVWATTSNRDGRGSPDDADDRILRVPG